MTSVKSKARLTETIVRTLIRGKFITETSTNSYKIGPLGLRVRSRLLSRLKSTLPNAKLKGDEREVPDISVDEEQCGLKLSSLSLLELNFDLAISSNLARVELMSSRRRFWRLLFFDPFDVDTRESEKNDSLIVTKPHDLTDFVLESSSLNGSSNLNVDKATLALMVDGVRPRLFVNKTRMALNTALAPIQLSIILAPNNPSKNLELLQRYLTLLCQKNELVVCNDIQSYDQADAQALPWLIVLSEKSLEDGIVSLRDRETCWFEQVHVTHVVQRLVQIYQQRVVPDLWTDFKVRNGIESRNNRTTKRVKNEKGDT